MNEESLKHLERQIAGAAMVGAPPALRAAVLADVGCELRAARWDRRLARAAVVLLVAGVGMNVAAGLQSENDVGGHSPVLAAENPRRSLVDTAVVVAEATDAETGRQFARQMAAMTGHKLTMDEAAAIDAAVGQSSRDSANEKKG
jgi:hypothetical protein